MEEPESPVEELREHIHHHAEHSHERWVSLVALSTALLAALAALAGLLAGHHANEAMIEQIRASDRWAEYQSKSIKSELLSSKLELLSAVGHRAPSEDQQHVAKREADKEKLSEQAKELEQSSQNHLKAHAILARAVTMFQVAIAISAIAVLLQRQRFWYVSLALAAIGVFFLVQGVLPHA